MELKFLDRMLNSTNIYHQTTQIRSTIGFNKNYIIIIDLHRTINKNFVTVQNMLNIIECT